MILKSHWDLSDQEYTWQFEAGSFPPRLFSHEAHLRLAWIHLRQGGLKQALASIPTQIRQFAIQVGVPDKYHETVTRAAIYAVHHFMQKTETDQFETFIAEHPALQHDFKSLINSHYLHDIFKDEQARKAFIPPDAAPFT